MVTCHAGMFVPVLADVCGAFVGRFVQVTVQIQTAVGFQAMTIAIIAMADDGGTNYATRRKQNAYNRTENEETAERGYRKMTNQNQI